jgi:hypothetical protein
MDTVSYFAAASAANSLETPSIFANDVSKRLEQFWLGEAPQISRLFASCDRQSQIWNRNWIASP